MGPARYEVLPGPAVFGQVGVTRVYPARLRRPRGTWLRPGACLSGPELRTGGLPPVVAAVDVSAAASLLMGGTGVYPAGGWPVSGNSRATPQTPDRQAATACPGASAALFRQNASPGKTGFRPIYGGAIQGAGRPSGAVDQGRQQPARGLSPGVDAPGPADGHRGIPPAVFGTEGRGSGP